MFWPATDDNARLGRLPVVFPIILGHEGAGTVVRTGASVTKVGPGDKVLFTPDYCGRCEQCVLGLTPYCDQGGRPVTFTGTRPRRRLAPRQAARQPGARRLLRPVKLQHPRPGHRARTSSPSRAGAPLHYLAGFTCGVQTGAGAMLNAMPVNTGSRVAVWGTGAVGLAAVMAAKASGAAEIVALDRVGHRLALAVELGATATIDTAGQDLSDVAAAVVKLTGRGANVALDTTGNPAVILAAVQSLATHGVASVITSSGAPVTLPPGDLLLRGRQLRGTMGGHINPTIFIPRLLELHAQGRFPVDRLVKNYPFAELNTAIADSLSGQTIKPVLTFEE